MSIRVGPQRPGQADLIVVDGEPYRYREMIGGFIVLLSKGSKKRQQPTHRLEMGFGTKWNHSYRTEGEPWYPLGAFTLIPINAEAK